MLAYAPCKRDYFAIYILLTPIILRSIMSLYWASLVVQRMCLQCRRPGDLGSITGSGRYPGEGNNNPPQYTCLGNPLERGAWWPTVHGVTKELDMT